MRQILATEDHEPAPPMLRHDPFYRITRLVKEEIRKHKWIEGEKGRQLSWEQASAEWTEAYREEYEKFLLERLVSPWLTDEGPRSEKRRGGVLSLPHRIGG